MSEFETASFSSATLDPSPQRSRGRGSFGNVSVTKPACCASKVRIPGSWGSYPHIRGSCVVHARKGGALLTSGLGAPGRRGTGLCERPCIPGVLEFLSRKVVGFVEVRKVVVLAFDPGVTTGWTWISVRDEVLRGMPVGEDGGVLSFSRRLQTGKFRSGSLDGSAGKRSAASGPHVAWDNESVAGMMRKVRGVWKEAGVESGKDIFFVVVEDFILRLMDQGRALLAPVRVSAAFEWEMERSGAAETVPVLKQQPSEAKRVVTDERLRAWGLYDAGSGPHSRDATRHAVLALRKYSADAELRGFLKFRAKVGVSGSEDPGPRTE